MTLCLLSVCPSSPADESHKNPLLPVPEAVLPQTKVTLYGDYISSKKILAKKHANDRKNQLARRGPAPNKDFPPLSPDKLEHEFVSEVDTAELHTEMKN